MTAPWDVGMVLLTQATGSPFRPNNKLFGLNELVETLEKDAEVGGEMPHSVDRLVAPFVRSYRVDSRGTRMGSINTVFAARLRLEPMDLISMSAACWPIAVLLWSIVERGTRSKSE